jgi:Peptidase family C78
MLCSTHSAVCFRDSCGFRNTQMLLTALLPLLPSDHSYFRSNPLCSTTPAHNVVAIPTVPQIQQGLDRLWADGWDPEGARHYRNRSAQILHTCEEIGAVEVTGWCNYHHLDSTTIQFIRCNESRQLLGPFCYQYFRSKLTGDSQQPGVRDSKLDSRSLTLALLTEATKFSDANEACVDDRSNALLPLYLQWPGHSVSVVGVVASRSGHTTEFDLLLFDPSKPGDRLLQCFALNGNKRAKAGTALAPFRFSVRTLLNKDCQLVVSTTGPLSEAERQKRHRQLSTSVVTAAEDSVRQHLGVSNR